MDGVTAKMAEGQVTFDGRIGLDGFNPSDLALTATGRSMRLRYPEGVRSEIDADLALTGRVTAPVLSGSVNVQSAVWTTRFDTSFQPVRFQQRRGRPWTRGAARRTRCRCGWTCASTRQARCASRTTRRTSRLSADLTFRGTYERPVVFGRSEITRGEFLFEGRRYVVTRGHARLQQHRPHRAHVRCGGRDAGARVRTSRTA